MYGFEAIQEGNGLSLMLAGMVVVFTSLVALIVMMKVLRIAQEGFHSRKISKQTPGAEPKLGEGEIPGVTIAAIALTMILEEESVHDDESMVLTLRAFPKPYSNWWMRDLSTAWRTKPSKTSTR